MNKDMPLVSVILPTYNRADVVNRSIDSVLGQTYKNIELIVVDDGSKDNTEELLKSYKDRIVYIKQPNKGVSSARNTGISIANGRYIAFIDSDDVWYKDKLTRQLEFFKEHSNKNLSLVSTDVVVIGLNGVAKDKRKLIKRNHTGILKFADLLKDPYLGLPTVIIDRNYLSDKENTFDEGLATAEDIDLYLNLSVRSNLGYIHEKLVEVHVTKGSLSESTDSYSDNIYVVKRFLEMHGDLLTNYKKVMSGILSGIIYEYAKTLLWKGNANECRHQLLESFKYKITIPSLLLYLKSYLVY